MDNWVFTPTDCILLPPLRIWSVWRRVGLAALPAWGMTTTVPPNLQYALLDYITHIISEVPAKISAICQSHRRPMSALQKETNSFQKL